VLSFHLPFLPLVLLVLLVAEVQMFVLLWFALVALVVVAGC
jgi:hypothetical protein